MVFLESVASISEIMRLVYIGCINNVHVILLPVPEYYHIWSCLSPAPSWNAMNIVIVTLKVGGLCSLVRIACFSSGLSCHLLQFSPDPLACLHSHGCQTLHCC